MLCEFHKQECTFVQSPLPRKRKVVDSDGKKDENNNQKKRYVRRTTPFSPCLLLADSLMGESSLDVIVQNLFYVYFGEGNASVPFFDDQCCIEDPCVWAMMSLVSG